MSVKRKLMSALKNPQKCAHKNQFTFLKKIVFTFQILKWIVIFFNVSSKIYIFALPGLFNEAFHGRFV